jgi:hypothetical protein
VRPILTLAATAGTENKETVGFNEIAEIKILRNIMQKTWANIYKFYYKRRL